MNKINDTDIQNLVNDQYKYLKNKYGADKMLGVFVYGKATYGFAETMDDIQTVMCYLPTFEELCSVNPEMKYIEYNDRTICIADVRLLLEKALTRSGLGMEAIFSKWYKIHPKYENVFFNKLFNNRETIYRTNQKARVLESIDQIREKLLKYQQTGDLDYLFRACRRRIATNQYINGTSIENCLYLKQDYFVNYLWSIKNGEIVPDLEELEQDLLDMEEQANALRSYDQGEKIAKEAITEIMRLSFTSNVYGQEFIDLLTTTEQAALKVVLAELQEGEGNISISQLINSSEISRPVFKSLMDKMKDNEIAEVTNMGVKGTYVKLFDNTLLDLL